MFLLFCTIAAISVFLAVYQATGAAPPLGSNTLTSRTVSGKSTCFTQNLKVSATTDNIRILLSSPVNQTVATEYLVELLQSNSDLPARVNGGRNTIRDTYSIYGQLCVPSDPRTAKSARTIQFLSHGDTLDHTYWDIAPGYSYIDAAVAAGYATFSYDRIGVGKSQHPDPLQVVQGPLQVEIAHSIVTMIRNDQIGPHSFKNVVGVGHSAGSTVTQGVTAKYPQDFDAVILTGTSVSADFVNTALASFDMTIANLDASGKFPGLPNGYLVQPNPQSIQFPYYRFPNFDPQVFAAQVASKQTQTFGELLTLGTIVAPSAQFRGAVDVVLGENDLVFCGGDCTKPQDQSALVAPVFYPAASHTQHYIVPGAGHSIFAHYSAGMAFAHMLSFLKSNGV
ncbi:MAG: hypothetical protein LQ338_005850 [Usnochroma carphineum]|nr:MAG: hypothetical protein LQ338_005850 [Usnochroma carphineum]